MDLGLVDAMRIICVKILAANCNVWGIGKLVGGRFSWFASIAENDSTPVYDDR